MINFDDLPDKVETGQLTLDNLAQERSMFVDERGTTMDILHDLWAGTGQALDLFGRATGAEGVQKAGERIQGSQFALPDTSQFYGTQGRVGRVVDGIAQSLPTTLAIGGTAAVGGLLAGPIGAAAGLSTGMSILGGGVFDQSLEEIRKERPDLSAADHFDYAIVNALSEVGSEGIGFLLPIGLGKAFSKTATKSILDALVESGRLTSKEAVASVVKSVGAKDAVKAMFGGAVADGASEVINELIQSASREAYGLEENPVDYIDIFLIGSAPGGIIAGGTMALDQTVKSKVKREIEAGLQSTDAATRVETVNTVASGLSNISPEVGNSFRESFLKMASEGPVSLDATVKKTAVKQEIIENPEKVIEAHGNIPVDPVSDAQAADRESLETPEQTVFPETRVLDEGILDTPQGQGTPILEPEPLAEEATAQERAAFEYNQMRNRKRPAPTRFTPEQLAEYEAYEPTIPNPEERVEVIEKVSDYMKVAESPEFTMADYRKAMEDEALKSSILQGMDQVEADSNELKNPQLTLVERRQLRKSIQNTKDMINEEVALIKKSQGKPIKTPKTVPVETPKAKPIVPEVKPTAQPVAIEPEAVPTVEPEVSTQEPEVAPQEAVVPEEVPVAEETKQAVETPSEAPIDEPALAPERAKVAADLVADDHPIEVAMEIAKSDLKAGKVKLASNLMKQGVKPKDSIILAKKGIKDASKPVEVEREMRDTPKGKRFKSARYTNGASYAYNPKQTTGKEYKVFGRDGNVYRASTQEAAHEFIQGKRKLEPWDDKGKGKTGYLREETKKLTEKAKSNVNEFIAKLGTSAEKNADNSTDAVYKRAVNQISKGTVVKGDVMSKVGFAIAKAAKSGKKLTISSVREQLEKAEAIDRNTSEATRKAKQKLDTTNISMDTLFASEEAKAAGEEHFNDMETESILDDTDSPIEEGDTEVTTEANPYIQEGKGKYELKTTWYEPDGTKVSAKKKSKDAKSILQTPDERFALYPMPRGADNVQKFALLHDGDVIGEPFNNPQEATEYMKEFDRERSEPDPTPIENYPTQQRTIIRRRARDVDYEINNRSPVADLAHSYISSAGSISGAIEAINRKMDKTPEMVAAEEYLTDLLVNTLESASRYKTARDVLDSIATTNTGSAQLAKFLLKRANVGILDGVNVVIGDKNAFTGSTNTLTLKAESSPATRLHEVIHALTSKVLVDTTPEAQGYREEIEGIMDEVRKYAVKEGILTQEDLKVLKSLETSQDFLDAKETHQFKNEVIAYSLLNPKEFLAQAFGSRETQLLLNKVKVKSDRSLMDKFIDLLLRVLGFDAKQETALREILKITEDVSYENVYELDGSIDYALEPIEVPNIDAEVAKVMSGKGPAGKLRSLWDERGNVKNFAEKITRPVADIIETYSEKIYGELTKFEANLIMNQREYSNKVKPFMKWYKGLSKSNQVRYSLALMNSNLSESKKIIDEIPRDVMNGVNEVLADLKERQDNVGLGVQDKEYYFPRRVTNIGGLMDFIMKDEETNGMIGYAFKQEAKRLGLNTAEELTDAQRTQVVTDMMQSGNLRQLPRPGASKDRTIPFVTAEFYEFYADASDALMGHIFEMNEKIGQREFIGGSTRKRRIQELLTEERKISKMAEGEAKEIAKMQYDEKAKALEDLEADLQNSLATMIHKELGKESSEVQNRVKDLLNARLRQKGAHGIADAFRNITYLTTMGNFLSAITQLADIPIIFYANGANMDSLNAVGTAFKNVYKVARNEFQGKVGETDAFVDQIDFTNQLREFSKGSMTASWVDKVFQLSGLKYTDLIGKEAFMQAAYAKYRKGKNQAMFMKKYEPMFGGETQRVWDEFQSGKKSTDVLTVLIAELSRFQPITLSQQSELYLGGGNIRLFYMLKTFTLRATSAAFREGAVDINKGGAKNIAKGTAKIVGILMLYAAAGAGADELKDLIRGKESSFSDNTMDNMLQMLFMSKYSIEKGFREDNIAKQITSNILPPVRFIDSFGADMWALVDDKKEFKAKSLTVVPFVGTTIYSRSGPGQATFARMEKEDILKEVAKNKANKKAPYAGGLSAKIREYNRKVRESGGSRDTLITNDSVMRKYRSE